MTVRNVSVAWALAALGLVACSSTDPAADNLSAPAVFTIGGTVAGLTGAGLVLQNNGADDLPVSTDGSFVFPTAVADGASYNVSVLTQPTGQTCTTSSNTGTVSGTNVTNVSVTCSANTYVIGGAVTGLHAGNTVVLQNNNADDLTVYANGTFTFATAIAHGGPYSVTVKTQPSDPDQVCTVSQGSGIVGADVTDVSVSCVMKLVSISVAPADPFIARSIDAQMTATGTYSDGSTRDITNHVTWSSSDTSKIAISPTGVASFVKVGGPVTIAASGPGGVEASVVVPARSVMFTTSVTGLGNLAAWIVGDAPVGNAGLVAADAICSSLAAGAGVEGTFKAWLSDDVDDAYCRIAGYSGKKATNCGQASLPTAGGPWIRTDGYPLTRGLIQFSYGDLNQYYTPPLYDESGTEVATKTMIYTASYYDGAKNDAYGTTCDTWSMSSPNVVMTLSTHSSNNQPRADLCNAPARLACFQLGEGAPLPPFESPGKKVFITSTSGSGNLGAWAETAGSGKTGLEAGDAICQVRAAAAGLDNADNFKAWLSDGSTNAKDRFVHSDTRYLRIDGAKVADNMADLSSGSIFTGIQLTENGIDYWGRYAWTATNADGTATTTYTCSNWTDADSANRGWLGTSDMVDSSWTKHSSTACSGIRNLYCVED